MQLIWDIVCIGAFLFLLFKPNLSEDHDTDITTDITNLYSSRDRLWKELFKLQQTSKRRDQHLRSRIYNLECKLKHCADRDSVHNIVKLYGITRGKSETQQASSS